MTWAIGSTVATIDLSSLGISRPTRDPYSPWGESRKTATGLTRALGWASCVWEWERLTTAEREVFRTLIPGAAAELYIITRKEDRTFSKYRAIAYWPDMSGRSAIAEFFALSFALLEEITQ